MNELLFECWVGSITNNLGSDHVCVWGGVSLDWHRHIYKCMQWFVYPLSFFCPSHAHIWVKIT